jgi:hypothetical protein
MRVPRALERWNAGQRSLSVQPAGNRMRLGFEVLRLTAKCRGDDESLAASRLWS